MVCKDGYFGKNCNPCPLGTFGTECAGRCSPNCTDEICDSVRGCIGNSEKTTLGENSVSTSGTTSRRILSERTVWITSKTKGVSITEEPNTNKEIEIKFVLIGGGIIILMVFFVIVIQLYTYKSSRSAKFKPLKRNRKKETLTSKHYTGNVQQGNEQSENQKQLIQTVESDYQDIEESIELRALPVLTGEYISPIQTSQPQTSYYPLTPNDILQSQQWNDQYNELVSELVDENKSNLYLQPINV